MSRNWYTRKNRYRKKKKQLKDWTKEQKNKLQHGSAPSKRVNVTGHPDTILHTYAHVLMLPGK